MSGIQPYSEEIVRSILTQMHTFTGIQDPLDQMEITRLAGEMALELKNRYNEKNLIVKKVPSVDNVNLYDIKSRHNSSAALQTYVNGVFETNYHTPNVERVTRRKGEVIKIAGLSRNFIEKHQESILRSKATGELPPWDLTQDWLVETQEARIRYENVLAVHNLYRLAASAPLFTGSADFNDPNFIGQGAIITPGAGVTALEFNPEIHIDNPGAGYTNDVAVNTATFLNVLKRLADKHGSGGQGGGVFYLAKHAKRLLNKIRDTNPTLFSMDYSNPLTGGLQYGEYMGSIYGIRIQMLDDLSYTAATYGTGADNTYFNLGAGVGQIDTRNVFGFFLVGDRMPLEKHTYMDITHKGQTAAADHLFMAFQVDFVDPAVNSRADVVVVESRYRFNNIDRIRGPISTLY